jgi:tRNA threonylcarbamoyladenosine biosynthesis protein TsaE
MAAALRLTSCGPADTERIGAELAARLRPGEVVLLTGELGSGKTTFVRGACRALGVDAVVSSPTFTIGQRYQGGRAPVAHVDLYRIASLADEDPGLLAEYVNPRTIAFVEWAEAARDQLVSLGRIAASVRIEHLGGDRRRVTVT